MMKKTTARSMAADEEAEFGACQLLWKAALAREGGLGGAKTVVPRLASRSQGCPFERSLGASQTVRSGRIVRSLFQPAVLGASTLEGLEW